MRYFTAPPQLFNFLRSQIMLDLCHPNGKADQPWAEEITSIALSPHEYTRPEFTMLIEYALENGATEITEEEYQALQQSTTIE